MNFGPSISTGEDRFYDTNFFLHHGDKLPNGARYSGATDWITETTEAELIAKLGDSEARMRIGQRFEILRFDDLYEKIQEFVQRTIFLSCVCIGRPILRVMILSKIY